MMTENFVAIQSLCTHYEVEESFFNHLTEFGLIEIRVEDETPCIALENLHEVEKVLRMYHELNINMEDIDIVFNLLKKIMELQTDLAKAQNRLRLYED